MYEQAKYTFYFRVNIAVISATNKEIPLFLISVADFFEILLQLILRKEAGK